MYKEMGGEEEKRRRDTELKMHSAQNNIWHHGEFMADPDVRGGLQPSTSASSVCLARPH